MVEQDWQAGDVFYVVKREWHKAHPEVTAVTITRVTPQHIYVEPCSATGHRSRFLRRAFDRARTVRDAARDYRDRCRAEADEAATALRQAEQLLEMTRD